MFGVDNLCWISAKATSEASIRAELLILQTGMTAFGKAYYRNLSDLVPNVGSQCYMHQSIDILLASANKLSHLIMLDLYCILVKLFFL